MPEEIIDHRDFCQRLIELPADCLCNNRNPITAVCLCYALSSDSSPCLRRPRAARDVVAAVPPSANPPIPAMNQHAIVATISNLAEGAMTRPLNKQALAKLRDQAMPVSMCEPLRATSWDRVWLWRTWCPHCCCFHHHSPVPGHRVAHCVSPTSPFKKTGYVLMLDPKFKDLDDLCQHERREEKLRKQKSAERKAARPAADQSPTTAGDCR
jgi:hypothetical protein